MHDLHEVPHGMGQLPTEMGKLIEGIYLARVDDSGSAPVKGHVVFARFRVIQVSMGKVAYVGSSVELRSPVVEWWGPFFFQKLRYRNSQGEVTSGK